MDFNEFYELKEVANNKNDAINQLSLLLKNNGCINNLNEFKKCVYEREAEISTDLTPLLSVPLARSSEVVRSAAAKMKTKDGRDVYLLASNNDEWHIKTLAEIAEKYVSKT